MTLPDCAFLYISEKTSKSTFRGKKSEVISDFDPLLFHLYQVCCEIQ